MEASLYQRSLGDQFALLAAPLQCFHASNETPLPLRGTVSIARGKHWLAAALCNLMRLPKSCALSDCTVVLTQSLKGARPIETWARRMNGQAMVSQQSMDVQAGSVLEAAFPYAIVLANRVKRGALWQRSEGGRLLGIALPSALQLKVVAAERGLSESSFSFDVRIYLPYFGRVLPLLHYRGELHF
jgi:Domain of unknown function (DUF4166)